MVKKTAKPRHSHEENFRDFIDAVIVAAEKHLPPLSDDDATFEDITEPRSGFAITAFVSSPSADGQRIETEVGGTVVGVMGSAAHGLYTLLEGHPELLSGVVESALKRMDTEYDNVEKD